MSKKVVICSDSTTDLNAELIAKYDIKTVPLSVNLGGKVYTDGLDVDPDMIYRHYEAHGELPKTAAPNIAAFCSFFEYNTGKEGNDGRCKNIVRSCQSMTRVMQPGDQLDFNAETLRSISIAMMQTEG